jgi:hypothetical protein
MGQIRSDFGRIAVESRRESFYLHANYGYVPGCRPAGDLRLHDEVVHDDRRWVVTTIDEKYVRLRLQDGQVGVDPVVVDLAHDVDVVVPGYEEDAPGPHAARWRETGSPEFLVEDLDDVIAALKDYRASLRADPAYRRRLAPAEAS